MQILFKLKFLIILSLPFLTVVKAETHTDTTKQYSQSSSTVPPASEAAAETLRTAISWKGQEIRGPGGVDCWTFVYQLSGKKSPEKRYPAVGQMYMDKQRRLVSNATFSPGQILSLKNVRSRRGHGGYITTGANHWAVVKEVNADGGVVILQQNAGGKLYVTEETFYPDTITGGVLTIYQP